MKIKVIDFGYEKLPFRAHENDAGADVHACFHDGTAKRVGPGETIKVPLGMGICLVFADGKRGVQKQNAFLCPFGQGSVFRAFTADIRF